VSRREPDNALRPPVPTVPPRALACPAPARTGVYRDTLDGFGISRGEGAVKFLWSLLTVILGAVGILAILRAGERLAFGVGINSISIQMVIGFVCSVGAWKSLQKARGR
jgi:hypothetical protein